MKSFNCYSTFFSHPAWTDIGWWALSNWLELCNIAFVAQRKICQPWNSHLCEFLHTFQLLFPVMQKISRHSFQTDKGMKVSWEDFSHWKKNCSIEYFTLFYLLTYFTYFISFIMIIYLFILLYFIFHLINFILLYMLLKSNV